MAENIAEDYASIVDRTGGEDNRETTGWFSRMKTFVLTSHDRLLPAVVCTILFAVSFAYTISQHLTASQAKPFPKYVAPMIIMLLEFIASIFLVVMFVSICIRRCCRSTQPWYRIFRRDIYQFGLGFYIAVFIFNILRLNAHWACKDASVMCTNGVVRDEHMTDLFYPLLNVLYLLAELLVCITFTADDFYQITPVFLALAVIQAANLSSWLDALVDESHVFSSKGNWQRQLSRCFNQRGWRRRTRFGFNKTDVNISDHFIQCYSHTTPEYQLLESASPYLYPFIMEYLMLVMECVADWYFSEHSQAPPSADDQDECLLLAERIDANANADADHAPVTCHSISVYYYIFVSVGILINLTFLILGICSVIDIVSLDMFVGYRIFYWLSLSICGLAFCLYTVHIFFVHPTLFRPINPNGFEYFVIFSSIAPILQCILSVVANIQTEDSSVSMTGLHAEEYFNMIEVFTQLWFYAKAKRFQIDIAENREHNYHRRCRQVLKVFIWYFAVSNFALWLQNSFIETRSSVTSWQKQFFDNWPIVYNIFNPMSLVFRFNSALLFVKILRNI